MNLNKIFDSKFYRFDRTYTRSDFKVGDIFKDDMLYKIDLFEIGSIEYVGSYVLGRENYSDAAKYPENALTLDLKKGEYILAYKDEGIVSRSTGKVNDCIKSSLQGEVKFDEITLTQEEVARLSNDSDVYELMYAKKYVSNSCYEFKVTAKSKLHLWIDDDNTIGRCSFSVYKVSQEKQDFKHVSTIIGNKDNEFSFNLTDGIYELTIYEMQKDIVKPPKYKYPVGTYQITLNDLIASSKDEKALSNAVNENKSLLSLSGNPEKLTSLAGIEIPSEVDPIKRYVMIGKVELNLYIDFNNDQYYLYPISYAECFLNLFVPPMEVDEIEVTETYAVYNITDFILVSYDFHNVEDVKRSIKKWIQCDDRDIHIDQYSLYYFIENFNLYDWYYSRFFDVINKHFIFIEFNPVNAIAYDIITNPVEDPATSQGLEYSILSAVWRVADAPANKYNFIAWAIDENWQVVQNGEQLPDNVTAAMPHVEEGSANPIVIKTTATGTGYLKISKKHFMNVAGVDLTYIKYGNLSEEQFRMLNLNGPIINPYNRFQYWMGIKL